MNLLKIREEIVSKYGLSQVSTITEGEIIEQIKSNVKVQKRIEKIKAGECENKDEYFNLTVDIAIKNIEVSDIEFEKIDWKSIIKNVFEI